MKPSFQPEIHYVPFEKRRTRRVTRTLMILISLVIAIGIVFHLAKTVLLSSTAWLQEPTQRPGPREHTSAERVPSAVAQHTGQD